MKTERCTFCTCAAFQGCAVHTFSCTHGPSEGPAEGGVRTLYHYPLGACGIGS